VGSRGIPCRSPSHWCSGHIQCPKETCSPVTPLILSITCWGVNKPKQISLANLNTPHCSHLSQSCSPCPPALYSFSFSLSFSCSPSLSSQAPQEHQ
jgi:hypothetical protein